MFYDVSVSAIVGAVSAEILANGLTTTASYLSLRLQSIELRGLSALPLQLRQLLKFHDTDMTLMPLFVLTSSESDDL